MRIPLLDQFDGLKWEIIDLDSKQQPGASSRQRFTEIIMTRLSQSLTLSEL
jgi:type I restriction enzyme R subunit